MRFTTILLRQHIGRMFKAHWKTQAKRKPIKTAAEQILKSRGVPIYNPEDFLKEKRTFEKVEVVGYKEKPIVFDNTHPDWHDRLLLSYTDNNVLLEGLEQAKILTKSVEIKEGLPDRLSDSKVAKEVHEAVKKVILNSHIFDAEQQKLPKVKDPERPAWNFPRTYGIPQDRRCTLLISKLLQLIESTTDTNRDKYLFSDLFFSLPFERNEHLIQLELTGDFVLTSTKPLSSITKEFGENLELPDISPIDPIVSLVEKNIYKLQNIYPVNANFSKAHPHTIFVNFNKEKVRNLFEEEVTEEQIYGRSLLKAFTVTASYAKQQYGDDVKTLPRPVSVQCVQTDGQFFHIGVFQLNTLELTSGNKKNIWYQTTVQKLFESCSYELGKPVLKDYNKNIINQLFSLYNSV